jgi:hypothetical protein
MRCNSNYRGKVESISSQNTYVFEEQKDDLISFKPQINIKQAKEKFLV